MSYQGGLIMRTTMLAITMALAVAGCSSLPRPLVPDTPEGPASYVCYSSWVSEPAEIRAIADKQCRTSGLEVKALLGQAWTPFRCGLLTPEVAAFRCGKTSTFWTY